MDIVIELNISAFKHGISAADIRWAFDNKRYDGWFNEGERQDKDKYLLIGFDRNLNPLEILYYYVDDKTINVFHAMKCRSIYYHLIQKEEKMARMTDEEANYWDEYYTKNPPRPGPNGTGFFTQQRKTACSITIDDLSADWLMTKAISANKTPAEIISDMIQKEIAASN